MSTVPATLPPARLRRLRLGFDILLVVLVLASLLCALAYWYVRSDQPHLDGTLAMAGLSAPVTIVRDTRGIPHILSLIHI